MAFTKNRGARPGADARDRAMRINRRGPARASSQSACIEEFCTAVGCEVQKKIYAEVLRHRRYDRRPTQ